MVDSITFVARGNDILPIIEECNIPYSQLFTVTLKNKYPEIIEVCIYTPIEQCMLITVLKSDYTFLILRNTFMHYIVQNDIVVGQLISIVKSDIINR